MFCARCGAPNRAQARRCASCGAALTSAPEEPQRAPGRPRRVPASAPKRPVPQAPSTQMGPPAQDPRRRASPASPWSIPPTSEDDVTLLEAAAPPPPSRPEYQPTPVSHASIEEVGFGRAAGAEGREVLQAETLMTPDGGGARRAWQDVADAGAAPAQARFGGSARDEPDLDVETAPEAVSGVQDGPEEVSADRTRQVPVSQLPGGGQRDRVSHKPLTLRSDPARPATAGPTSPLPVPEAADDDDDDDEPPNEPTRLGDLAGAEGFGASPPAPLVSVPVHDPRRAPDGPQETMAAPGALAGLVDDLAPGGLPPFPEPVSAPRPPVSPSTVRRGLEAPLPVSSPEVAAYSEPTEGELGALEEAPLADTKELDGVEPLAKTAPRPLEDTHAMLESLDENVSMPGEPAQLLREPRPLAPRDETPQVAEAGVLPRVTGDSATGPEMRWTAAPRARRLLSTALDAGLLVGLVAIPALLGLFGPEVAEARLDPDDVSQLLWQGHLTQPLLILAILGLGYGLATAMWGRSLGKLAFGLELVANGSGRRPGAGRAAWRALAGLLTVALGAIGPLFSLLNGHARGLHDLLAGTTVVRSGTRSVTGAPDGDDAPPG